MANTAEETGREGLVAQATSQVQDAASTAQDKAAELTQEGKGRLGEALDQRTNQAGDQVRKMAQALRQSGEQMRHEGDAPQAAGAAEGAAERMERLGGYLEQTSGDKLLRDAEDFARRRPWVVAGTAMLVGVAASRFLKASSERRYGEARKSSYSEQQAPHPAAFTPAVPAADEPLARESYGMSA